MPKREDETWRNTHPPACSCTECVANRKKSRFPYPASIECPACGNISLYYSEKECIYKCINEECLITGETLTEISMNKT